MSKQKLQKNIIKSLGYILITLGIGMFLTIFITPDPLTIADRFIGLSGIIVGGIVVWNRRIDVA